MKTRSREINVFSISALDLFASALGAFVLLTVLLLPFAATIGRSGTSAEGKAAEAESKDSLREPASPTQRIALPQIDLVVAIDTTASMKEEIAALQGEVAALARILSRLSPSFAMGIVDFKDPTDVPSIRTHRLGDAGSESALRSLQAFVDGMVAGSGPANEEPEEGISDALQLAMAMQWRPEARRRIIVVISDEGALDEARALRLARTFAGREGSKVSAVVAGTAPGSTAPDFMSRLAEEGGGNAVRAGESMIGTILEAIVES